MLHRCDVRYGQRWRVGNRTNEARKRHENHGDCGSPWVAALGQHARGEPSRSPFGAAMLRLLHDRSQAAYSSAGSTTLRTSSALSSSPASLSSSDDFEIGSSLSDRDCAKGGEEN